METCSLNSMGKALMKNTEHIQRSIDLNKFLNIDLNKSKFLKYKRKKTLRHPILHLIKGKSLSNISQTSSKEKKRKRYESLERV